jgi:3',5'-cyclic AMP phosphodiesterase CpdA
MRVAFTSDLHIDITAQNRKLLPYLAEEIERLSPDALVLAGDIANTLSGWDVALQAFQPLAIMKFIVPGNHDIWIESKRALERAQDSTWKYNVGLPTSAARHGFHYLPQRPLVVGDVWFVGSLGWYDYSFRDERLEGIVSTREYEKGAFGSDIWNDSRYAAWLREPNSSNWRIRKLRLSNLQICSLILAALQWDLEQIPSEITKIAVTLHTSPFLNCIERKDVPDFFDAYEGCTRLGEILGRCATRRAVTVISGHRHKRLDITEHGVRVVRSPVGYLNDFQGDYRAKAAEVIGLIDL